MAKPGFVQDVKKMLTLKTSIKEEVERIVQLIVNFVQQTTLDRMRKLKSQMIEYKGGCCVRCGYKKYQGALEFHHTDPKEKDFNPS